MIAFAMLSGILPGQVNAATEENYGKGFDGRAYKLDAPLDVQSDRDRELRLGIRLSAAPTGFPSDFTAAFRAACERHARDLRKLLAVNELVGHWRVRVTFDWVLSSASGVTTTKGRSMRFHVADCRPW